MLKQATLATIWGAMLAVPAHAFAVEDQTLLQIRKEIKQIRESYEARIQALEQRLQKAEEKTTPTEQQAVAPPAAVTATTTTNAFNPAVSLILGGTYANLSQDPSKYRIQGFLPSGNEVGPGDRSFNLGESELSFSANIDPYFSGKLTFSLAGDNHVHIEEALFETQALPSIKLKGGRFLSSIGYINSQHAHAWDFVDAPLAYQAFFGGQYKQDGLQLRWLAPTERFIELGLETGRGESFPGNDRNKNGTGSTAIFVHIGDDIGASASWRTGISYLQTSAANRSYDDLDSVGNSVSNAFDGKAKVWVVDGIYKWAPNGNSTQAHFKLQGEYFRRQENGSLTYDALAQSLGSTSLPYASAQSGWYVQGIYQFMPAWRVGLRFDKLYSGAPNIDTAGSTLKADDFQRLSSYNPQRSSVMLDYSLSEFSRLRLQLAQDKSRPQATDKQLFLQYIMSLGTHGAHSF